MHDGAFLQLFHFNIPDPTDIIGDRSVTEFVCALLEMTRNFGVSKHQNGSARDSASVAQSSRARRRRLRTRVHIAGVAVSRMEGFADTILASFVHVAASVVVKADQ